MLILISFSRTFNYCIYCEYWGFFFMIKVKKRILIFLICMKLIPISMFKFPAPVSSNQSQSSIKRPSSAQPISSKLQHPMNLRQQLSQTNQQPQQSGVPRNFPPSLVPTPSSAATQQSRIRTFGPGESTPAKIGTTQQNFQGPLVKRMLSQGSKAPPPVPPNKPQVPILPQVQQNPPTRFAKPSNT